MNVYVSNGNGAFQAPEKLTLGGSNVSFAGGQCNSMSIQNMDCAVGSARNNGQNDIVADVVDLTPPASANTSLNYYEAGARIIAASDLAGCIYNANGLNIPELLRAKSFYGHIQG